MDKGGDVAEVLHRAIRAEIARDHAAVEQACERALLTGSYGVQVVRDGPRLISADPDPSVPYGMIHEHRLDLHGPVEDD